MKDFLDTLLYLSPLLLFLGAVIVLFTVLIIWEIKTHKRRKQFQTTHPTHFRPELIKKLARAMCKADGLDPDVDEWQAYMSKATIFLAGMDVMAQEVEKDLRK